ncbi:MAG TPA: TIGR03118 family protein [Terriglobales bacterium]|nr:TIGR03118 family protein [Terriglobales bacterium]
MRKLFARRPSLAVTVFALVFSCLASAQKYHRTDLTTDAATVSPSAANVDGQLLNPWGLARGAGGPWWVSDNGAGLSTVYNALGAPFVPAGATKPLVVTVPTPDGTGTAAPTGTVFNATSAFNVGPGAKAIFLFCTEDGTISGWNPAVNPASAVIVKNRSGKAIYKGCAIANIGSQPFFYVTNFQTGRVEIYNGSFSRINPNDEDGFRLPGLGKNWSPFNIQNVGGSLVVTFAHRTPGSEDEDHGPGLGHAGVFDAAGHLLMRLQDGSWFNAPWGVAAAPGDFGKFTHRLLVGNFGDGTIHAFNLFTGRHEGAMLDDTTGMTLSIDGLWAISFGGDATNDGLATTLYFSAGANDEADGIFGTLTAASDQPGNSQ